MSIKYDLKYGYVPPLGATVTAADATLIGVNSVSLATLLRPNAVGQGASAYWRFQVPTAAQSKNAWTVPYGQPGHVPDEAPGFFVMLFDPTLSRYAIEHTGVDHAMVRITYTMSGGDLAAPATQSQTSIDSPLVMTFYSNRTYSDVLVEVECWRETPPSFTKTYGAHYAVLRTSSTSTLGDWIQEEDKEVVIPMRSSWYASDGSNASQHYDEHKTILHFSTGIGHRGTMEYYRAFAGPNPWAESQATLFAWQSAQHGLADQGVHYWNAGGAVEYTGPPSSPQPAPYMPNYSTDAWEGTDVAYRRSVDTGFYPTLDVDTWGASVQVQLELLEEVEYLGRRGDGLERAQTPGDMWADIVVANGGKWNASAGTGKVLGLHWQKSHCEIKRFWVAPDHQRGTSQSGIMNTRWTMHTDMPSSAPPYGLWRTIREERDYVWTTDPITGITSGTPTGPLYARAFDVNFALGGAPAGQHAQSGTFMFNYNGTKQDWKEVDITAAKAAEKALNEGLYDLTTGEQSRNHGDGYIWFTAIPEPMVTSPDGIPPGWPATSGENTSAMVLNSQQRLAFKTLATPAKYRVHYAPVLEAAVVDYPEMSIDINFKLARRRFSVR